MNEESLSDQEETRKICFLENLMRSKFVRLFEFSAFLAVMMLTGRSGNLVGNLKGVRTSFASLCWKILRPVY